MWADVDTRLDFLNFSEVADLVADIVRDPTMRPVSVGVFGTWGTGKSTILNLVEANLLSEAADDVIIVRFDAWLYQGFDDARASLMEVIASHLIIAAKQDEGLLQKAGNIWDRVQKLRVLGLFAEAAAFMAGVPTFGVLKRGIEGIGDAITGHADEEDVGAIKQGGAAAAARAKSLLKPEKATTPPKEIDAFRKEFESLLRDLNKTLVVFVDNLDRCLPKQTIQTLEALRLFLFMDRTAFIVAADDDMIRHSVAEHFKEPDGRHVTDYLDKLIQVPVRVPRLGVQEIRAYLFLLLAAADKAITPAALDALRSTLTDNLRNAWRDDPISIRDALASLGGTVPEHIQDGFRTADRIASVLAKSSQVQGNPRTVKRMLNVIRMRAKVAGLRRILVDEALIAKMALFERCTDASAINELYAAINASPDGRSDLLKRLESLTEDPAEFTKALPDAWSKRVDFMSEWFMLEPSVGDKDLRALVYLGRETIPLRASRGGLSAVAIEQLDLLKRVTSSSSPSGRIAAAAVPVAEAEAVMAALIDEMRTHVDWASRPDAFYGAYLLAETSVPAAEQLSAFFSTAVPKLPMWAKVALRGARWYGKGGAR